MTMSARLLVLLSLAAALGAMGCTVGDTPPVRVAAGFIIPFDDAGTFYCPTMESQACVGDTHMTCESDGEFLRPVEDD
jgi:hypothetical protein